MRTIHLNRFMEVVKRASNVHLYCLRLLIQFRLIIVILGIVGGACTRKIIQKPIHHSYSDFNTLIHQDSSEVKFIKVHMKNGDVAILHQWEVHKSSDSLYGTGHVWDYNRHLKQEGEVRYGSADVVLIETNDYTAIESMDASYFSTLAVITGVNLALTIYCITNPKACYGSCPTFYIGQQQQSNDIRAEGFSSAITPSMEQGDVDALHYQTEQACLYLTMTNEALETHVVNQLEVRSVVTAPHETAFVDKYDRFYTGSYPLEPTSVTVDGNNILSQVCMADGIEYFSLTDENNLAAKEEIDCRFEITDPSPKGLVLQFRQTLLTTFLLYTGYSYMGDEVGDYLARMEIHEKLRKKISNPYKLLGGIEVFGYHAKKQKWILIEEVYETGPIASNQVIVPLREAICQSGDVRLKIRVSRGLWRFDQLGLSSCYLAERPVRIEPVSCIWGPDRKTVDAVDQICDDDAHYLVTQPGESYCFLFELPELNGEDTHQLFLYSKGYYLEWIRDSWIRNKNPLRLRRLLLNHPGEWRALAREYKQLESSMEEAFWNSKYTGD